MIEASAWWVLTKVDSKNIEQFIFYRNFTRSTVKFHVNNERRSLIFYISRSTWPIQLKLSVSTYINKLYIWKNFQLNRFSPWYSINFRIEGKTHKFGQFRYFVSSHQKAIEGWRFSWKHISTRWHCPRNFSVLEQIVRQGHFGQKLDFGPKFSGLLKPTIYSFLSSVKD